MMRKRIGWWLLVLASLASPTAARAQEWPQWRASPAADSARPEPASYVEQLAQWCAPAQPTAEAAVVPYLARGQDSGEGYYVPPVLYTGPFSHPRYEDGGFYIGAEFLYFRQTRPILSQVVAIRGFLDQNGSITGTTNQFVGSGEEALNTNMVQGSGNYQPGSNIFLGWRFKNGVTAEIGWWHLAESRYAATAGLIPVSFNVGSVLENTFLFSPVSNWPIGFIGNSANVLVNGNPAFGATPGIWNGASEMDIQFIQRFELVQASARIPIWETENYRAYGTFGGRAIIMWEKFWWRTVDRDVLGIATSDTTAIYTNIVSNRLYGPYCGVGHDWYLGSTPVGAFSVDMSINGAVYLDFVKGRARYELGDKSQAATRARNFYEVVPGFDGKIGMMWYPWEAIQLRVGYNMLALFNTAASPRPIDFNYGTIDPPFNGGSMVP
jgi:hypothetical protein